MNPVELAKKHLLLNLTLMVEDEKTSQNTQTLQQINQSHLYMQLF